MGNSFVRRVKECWGRKWGHEVMPWSSNNESSSKESSIFLIWAKIDPTARRAPHSYLLDQTDQSEHQEFTQSNGGDAPPIWSSKSMAQNSPSHSTRSTVEIFLDLVWIYSTVDSLRVTKI